jgi:hypothetical protein
MTWKEAQEVKDERMSWVEYGRKQENTSQND